MANILNLIVVILLVETFALGSNRSLSVDREPGTQRAPAKPRNGQFLRIKS
jgi:hypothetical protein